MQPQLDILKNLLRLNTLFWTKEAFNIIDLNWKDSQIWNSFQNIGLNLKSFVRLWHIFSKLFSFWTFSMKWNICSLRMSNLKFPLTFQNIFSDPALLCSKVSCQLGTAFRFWRKFYCYENNKFKSIKVRNVWFFLLASLIVSVANNVPKPRVKFVALMVHFMTTFVTSIGLGVSKVSYNNLYHLALNKKAIWRSGVLTMVSLVNPFATNES